MMTNMDNYTIDTVALAYSLVRTRKSSVQKAAADAVKVMKLNPSATESIEECLVEQIIGISKYDKPFSNPFAEAKVSDFLNWYEESLTGGPETMQVLSVECPKRAVRATIRLFLENVLARY